MKKLLLILTILVPSVCIFAQDVIVTSTAQKIDAKILEVNRQYLQHDYYTDIITFDDSLSHTIRGDIFISLDTVASNSKQQGTEYQEELHRVIIHGILHLCGINDKGPGERAIMEAAENKALATLKTL